MNILKIEFYVNLKGSNMKLFVLFFSIFLQFAIMTSNVAAHGAAKSGYADIKAHRGCAYCGMDRGQYSRSRMLVTYADKSVVGVCSIRCYVIELKAYKFKKIRLIEVADFNTKKLINAENAYWVVGGDVKGVMTRNPKWAFAEKAAAENFIKKNGGTLSSYTKVLLLAEKE